MQCLKSQNVNDNTLREGSTTSMELQEVNLSAAAAVVSVQESSDDTSVTDWPDLYELTEVDTNVVAYICSYLCMKTNKWNECTDCSELYKKYRID